MNTSRRQAGKALTALALAATGLGASTLAFAQGSGPIKVGILHSLSGTMAIRETVLKADPYGFQMQLRNQHQVPQLCSSVFWIRSAPSA